MRPGTDSTPSAPPPDQPEDGVLDSLGKAITDPVKTGAEKEEPTDDGRVPERPGG